MLTSLDSLNTLLNLVNLETLSTHKVSIQELFNEIEFKPEISRHIDNLNIKIRYTIDNDLVEFR